MIQNPLVDSATHILKGAVEKVLGTPLTTGVWNEENKGRLTVECTTKPTDEQMTNVQNEVNKKIEEGATIEVLTLDRKKAEEVFGQRMYDKFPLPLHINPVRVVHIKDWNVNCCGGNHVRMTKDVGRITIENTRYRETKGVLEISFIVTSGKFLVYPAACGGWVII